MTFHFPNRWSGSKAFTLTEALVALFVCSLAGAGLVALLRQVLHVYYYDSGRIAVNKDIRSFTQQMDTDAAFANNFMIFPNFATRKDDTTGLDANVADTGSGDFLVLITQITCAADDKPAVGMKAGNNYITSLTGYYRDAAAGVTGPVRRFSITIPNVDPTTRGTAPMASILDEYMKPETAGSNPAVIQLAQGLANGMLFYDYRDRSIMVRGQIIESGGKGNPLAVSTYNFTVSTRG
jgi:hypothetical protein